MPQNNQPIFQEYVSPEEVNNLPLTYYEGKIVLIQDRDKINEAVKEISEHKVLGFDTETRPTFTKGEFHHISLIQLAIPDKVFLFRINHSGFEKSLVDLMANENILKVGVGLRDDIIGLQKLHDFNQGGFKELHDYVIDLGVRNTGLRKLAAILLKIRISKGQQTSNWENPKLSYNQLRYAATDAWVCLEMYNLLDKKGFSYQD
ncbi:MAG: 3'-5' exonuclease domain-containing protein 2 [Bacteroidetes bacterium]|nr:MAG: 3'-5' exonuclease domain-containing protein 2 [Bacteroidota bacterium]